MTTTKPSFLVPVYKTPSPQLVAALSPLEQYLADNKISPSQGGTSPDGKIKIPSLTKPMACIFGNSTQSGRHSYILNGVLYGVFVVCESCLNTVLAAKMPWRLELAFFEAQLERRKTSMTPTTARSRLSQFAAAQQAVAEKRETEKAKQPSVCRQTLLDDMDALINDAASA